jgi:hypothetical protein
LPKLQLPEGSLNPVYLLQADRLLLLAQARAQRSATTTTTGFTLLNKSKIENKMGKMHFLCYMILSCVSKDKCITLPA